MQKKGKSRRYSFLSQSFHLSFFVVIIQKEILKDKGIRRITYLLSDCKVMQLFRVLGMNMFCDLRGRKEISHIYVDSDRGDLGISLFFRFVYFFLFFFLITVIETR